MNEPPAGSQSRARRAAGGYVVEAVVEAATIAEAMAAATRLQDGEGRAVSVRVFRVSGRGPWRRRVLVDELRPPEQRP